MEEQRKHAVLFAATHRTSCRLRVMHFVSGLAPRGPQFYG